MATETPAGKTLSAEERFKRKSLRKSGQNDVQGLERRVHLAELRMREAEAELRYLEASEKRRVLKNQSRERAKEKRGGKKTKGEATS